MGNMQREALKEWALQLVEVVADRYPVLLKKQDQLAKLSQSLRLSVGEFETVVVTVARFEASPSKVRALVRERGLSVDSVHSVYGVRDNTYDGKQYQIGLGVVVDFISMFDEFDPSDIDEVDVYSALEEVHSSLSQISKGGSMATNTKWLMNVARARRSHSWIETLEAIQGSFGR